jgi:hypothetical protein
MGLSYYECSRLRPRPRPHFVAALPIDPQAKCYDPTRPGKLQYIGVKAYMDTRAGCNAVSSNLVESIGLPIHRYKRHKRIPVPGGYIISLGTITCPFQYEGEQRWLSKHQVKRRWLGTSWLRRPWVPRRFWVDIGDFETPDVDSDSNDSETDYDDWLKPESRRSTKMLTMEVIQDCPRDLILGAEFTHKFDIFTKRRYLVSPARLGGKHSSGHRPRHSSGSPSRGGLHNTIDRQRYRMGFRR